ncbi:transglutaminase domain-containing protein [Bacillus sp. FJAT-28004]|uniref:transglutaminase domain-containing protein n=1 Tax=Bacillus sp. FJAT-28004 TaxID=1679165 RepID=UPI001F25F8EE|nr:transglutaminase domain-containing protein [Bacillus sp. FJAT-28004]
MNSVWTKQVLEKFSYKRNLARLREEQLFSVFQQPLSEEEKFALQFLYAYMPLNDLADYNGELFLSHVRAALDIRNKVPWGSTVPDDLFFHFVLPYRVNNENIEDIRGLLFHELFERVQGLSMTNAILETNYWCHEKATYTGNDQRTVSPLTIIRTTLGRCGEQSTLAVAALRSLGIPARQCYTPRWAHCDSNHAWVEAWADGRWHFLGACEPEARLDQGWFSEPAKRAMLVNTRVPSNYSGPEEITLQHPWYTEINLLDNYAMNKTITIKVLNQAGTPSDAKVHFQLYNYAEFSTIVTKITDPAGQVTLTTGLGSLYIHAVGEDGWNSMLIHTEDSNEFTIALSKEEIRSGISEIDMIPPPPTGNKSTSVATEQEKQKNIERIQEGAHIRAAYEATFVSLDQSIRLAEELSLEGDRVWNMLQKAKGNSHEIYAFLQNQSPKYGEWPLLLLESLHDKDLTDTFQITLNDHLLSSLPLIESLDKNLDKQFSSKYLLCPRVHYEMIAPYKHRFQEHYSQEEKEFYRGQPQAMYERLTEEFEIIEGMNHYNGSATPLGSFELKKGDRLCFHILLIATARSFGIPARLEPTDLRPQYWMSDNWGDFCSMNTSVPAVGFVQFMRDASATEQEAAYFHNFTIARWTGSMYQTQMLPFGKKDVFDDSFELVSGQYRLITGTRLPNGTARVRLAYFDISPSETTNLVLCFRSKDMEIPILASLSADAMDKEVFIPPLSLNAAVQPRGAVIAWIEPDREPSKHLLRELRELASQFEAWDGPVILAAGEDKLTASFSLTQDTALPRNAAFYRDESYNGLNLIQPLITPKMMEQFPILFVLDDEGRIRYMSEGYKLGTGKEVLDVIHAIANPRQEKG